MLEEVEWSIEWKETVNEIEGNAYRPFLRTAMAYSSETWVIKKSV